jgi:hypothetical protein
LTTISENDLPHNPRTVNVVLDACATAVPAADGAAAEEAADYGLQTLRGVLRSSEHAAARALGPARSTVVRGPPVDAATVELTRALLRRAPRAESDDAKLLHSVETATLKLKRPRRQPFKSTGARGRGGRGGRGRGRGPRR